MTWRFKVRAVTYLAGVYVIDGRLEEGEILHGATGIVGTGGGHAVTVKTVAFVNPPSGDRRELTLTIERPSFDASLLEGAEIVGALSTEGE